MKREIGTFLLFLLLATLLWYGHAIQSVRNTRVPVHIQYTGKPGAIGLGGDGLPSIVEIEVRDAGARLNSYYKEPLHLTIDLRPYIHGDKGTIQVPSDALRRGISNILQGTSQLIETTPEELVCPFYTEQEKWVALAFDGEIKMANEYQMVGVPTLRTSKIRIYGQDKYIASIDTLYTKHVLIEDLSDTTDMRIALALPPNTRAQFDSVDVHIDVERFTEKKFTLPIEVIGAPEGYVMRLFPHDVEVSVRVGISHFSQVQASDIRVFSTYSPERKDKLDVAIQYTNPYITYAWAYPGVVEFLLTEQQ